MFLFMAATVVAVVIFLCGVMVGRGVPQRAGVAPAIPEQANIDPTAAVHLPPPQAVASTGSTPLTAGETLTYADRLADPTPPPETLRPLAETAVVTQPAVVAERAPSPEPAPAPKPVPAPTPALSIAAPKPAAPAPAPKPAAPAPAPKPAPAVAAVSAAAPALAEPPGSGFVVQVAAVRKRAEAEVIARRLSAKGYPTFVTTSGANFRVRVGKYDDRREAETVAGRLEREERVRQPWITR